MNKPKPSKDKFIQLIKIPAKSIVYNDTITEFIEIKVSLLNDKIEEIKNSIGSEGEEYLYADLQFEKFNTLFDIVIRLANEITTLKSKK